MTIRGVDTLERDLATAQSVPARFEQLADLSPASLAIGADHIALDYRTLNDAANRVAQAVLETSPATNTVAVLMEHGALAVAAMLGVMKAGKIFVPLDPRQPSARILRILASCDARLLVVDRGGMKMAASLLKRGLVLIDAETIDAAAPASNPGLPIHVAAPACLLYTSGSTGLPKGVVLTHANLLHRTLVYTDVFQLGPTDRLTVLAPCSVAQGMSSTLQALMNGASLHPFELRERGVGELAPWLQAHGITVYVCTASTFRHFAQTLAPDTVFPSVRAVRLGSEEIFPQDIELYRRHFLPGCRLIASMGSTEAGAIAINVIGHDTEIGDMVPLGHAAPGVTVRIVDDAGRECAPGAPGEITVQSPYVSPGYWRDPSRTQAAFAGAAGERIFHTGDLGVVRSDGRLEFKGRKNLCAKIRGFRVELEEIERAICSHALIQEAVVVERQSPNGESRLAACVVARPDTGMTAGELRTHIRSTLPEHMVPGSFEFVSGLPRTASGKIDRIALAAARTTDRAAPVAERRPDDRIETRVLNLWEQLLDHRPLGLDHNFFEVGGNSLLAARLGVSIEREFGIKVPLAAFLTASTIAQQACLIRERQARPQWSAVVPIQPHGSKPPLFVVHLVDGNVLSYHDLVQHLGPDQPIYGIQSRGLDGASAIHTRIEDMARDYLTDIQRLYPVGPFALCGWSFGGIIAFEMARQFEREGRLVQLLALLDSRVRPRRSRKLVTRTRRVGTLLEGRSGWRRKMRTASQIAANIVWRKLILWHRSGGWLPRRMLNVTQANRNARRDYVPQPYSGKVTLFKVPQSDNAHKSEWFLGWVPLALGGLDTYDVPGTHRTMVFEPHVRALAARLSGCLDDAWTRAASNKAVSGDDKAA